MEATLIDTPDALRAFFDKLKSNNVSLLYVDLEGNNLSRHGTISLVTIHDGAHGSTSLIDTTTLGQDAFNIANADGQTLRDVFQSEDITKVFFDIRNDSDALYSLYNVKVQGIEDLQLMELASRTFQKRCVSGLAKCIERDAQISFPERRHWHQVKEKGRKLFAPELGGSYAVFDHRPLDPELKEYCIQDVVLMPHLRDLYRAKLCDGWWQKIEQETKARIVLSQSASFNGKGRHMAEGPRDWIYWRPTTETERARTFLTPKAVPVSFEAVSSTPVSTVEDAKPSPKFEDITDPVTRALRELAVRSHDPYQDSDDDDLYGGIRSSYPRSDSPYSRSGSPDYTACDTECGYCGSCGY